MSYLRELLKSQKPELHAALENAWTIANREVFPVMASNDESINSFPHSQNLETYLNSILANCNDLFSENAEIYLSPYELYCILMAILFHDFGRIKFDEGHGSFTKKFVLNNYQKYSIPSEELADAIAEICEIHKPLDENAIKPATILLDAGMGKVRVCELAGLLVLVDEMDTSYKRLKALYVLDQPKYYSGKGLFRNYIKGISYDFFTKAVYVSIDNKIWENTDLLSKDELNTVIFKTNNEVFPIERFKLQPEANGFFEFLTKELNFTEKERGLFETLIKNAKIFVEQSISPKLIDNIRNELDKHLSLIVDNSNDFENVFESDKKKLLKKLVQLDNPLKVDEIFRKWFYYYDYHYKEFSDELKAEINKTAFQKWPLIVVLPLVIRAIKESEKNSNKTIYLSRLGIHVKKWLIIYKEHLFDTEGNEAIEPVLDYDFLLNVIEGMWSLSKNILGEGWFTYQDLLNKVIRQGDINLIKLAVKRIEVITRNYAEEHQLPTLINYDNRRWCLIKANVIGKQITIGTIKAKIEALQNQPLKNK